jgi:choline dehydrogenase
VRGAPADFLRWEALGAAGWSWADVLPFYELVEARVPIRNDPTASWQPFQHVFVEGFEELGFARVADMNAPDAWGGVVGPWPQNRLNEIRQGTLITHVRRVRARPNFAILDRALVDRVLLDGDRAIGVRYMRGAQVHQIRAGEVILCAGAYGSPAILQRSGIGPASALAAAGVTQVADLPVGDGLRDHPQCLFLAQAPPELARMCGPGFAVVARGENYWSFPLPLDEEQGRIGLAFGLGVQEPRGSLRIVSADPAQAPLIDHHYREVIGSALFDRAWQDFTDLCAGAVWRAAGVRLAEGPDGLAGALRERLATAFHPAASCAIGRVVDAQLRVLGVDGLRVADASVFPDNVTNNPNLTCLMVGERVAAFASGAPAPASGLGGAASATA